jgi:hypothetical protein
MKSVASERTPAFPFIVDLLGVNPVLPQANGAVDREEEKNSPTTM